MIEIRPSSFIKTNRDPEGKRSFFLRWGTIYRSDKRLCSFWWFVNIMTKTQLVIILPYDVKMSTIWRVKHQNLTSQLKAKGRYPATLPAQLAFGIKQLPHKKQSNNGNNHHSPNKMFLQSHRQTINS